MAISLDPSLQPLAAIRLKRVCADFVREDEGDEQKCKRAKIADMETQEEQVVRTHTLVAEKVVTEMKQEPDVPPPKEQETKVQITPVRKEWSLFGFWKQARDTNSIILDCFQFLSRARKADVVLTSEGTDIKVCDPVDFVCLSSISEASQEMKRAAPEFRTDGVFVDLGKKTIEIGLVDTQGYQSLLDQQEQMSQVVRLTAYDHTELAAKIKKLDKNLAHTEDVKPGDVFGASLLLTSLMLRHMPTGQTHSTIRVEMTQFHKGKDVHITATGFQDGVSTAHLRPILQQFPAHIRDVVFGFPSAEVGREGSITVVFSPERLVKQSILI
jgi:hypothetical protein